MADYKLYIILTRTNTAVSRAIRIAMGDQYTHAAISLNEDLNPMYSFARRGTYNPFIGRFKHEDINNGLYRLQKELPGLVMELEVTKEQYYKAKNIINGFSINSELYKYNYMGLITCFFNIGASCDYRFVCSEFVYYILNEIGLVDFNVSRNLVRPQSLLKLKGEIIFEGNLKDSKYSSANYKEESFRVLPKEFSPLEVLKSIYRFRF